MIELRGERVVLRTLERAHCHELWEAYEPEEPLHTEPLNVGLSHEGAERWFEEIQAQQGRAHVQLGVFDLDGRLLGDIDLSMLDWRQRTARLGLTIARQGDRGRGYGSDAVRTLLRYAFEELDLYRVAASTAEYNPAAQRSLERCGFVCEGRERLALYAGGRRWDRLNYGLLRDEFPAALSQRE